MIIEWPVRNLLFPNCFHTIKCRFNIVSIYPYHEYPGKITPQENNHWTNGIVQTTKIKILYNTYYRACCPVFNCSANRLLRSPSNFFGECFVNNIRQMIIGFIVICIHHCKIRLLKITARNQFHFQRFNKIQINGHGI